MRTGGDTGRSTREPGADAGRVEARAISMAFPRGDGVHLVLDSVDLHVEPGAFESVIGPSGCGKSTLLKILSGLSEPTEGEVLIADRPASEAMRRREVGIVFQQATLLPWRSAAGNAALLREIGDGGRESQRVATEMLELVGLREAAGKLPAELSGGMAQRVGIARALALDPAILLMDEPFGALDAITRERMNRSLLGIWERTKKTVVLVTHGISEAVFMSDRIHVMGTEPGRIIETIEIELPRPRGDETMSDPRFPEYERHLRSLLIGDPGRAA